LIAGICAVMAMIYAAVLMIPETRHFFELTLPSLGMLITATIAGVVSIGALALAGFSVRAARDAE
jgi:hypothetical protein